MGNITSLRDWSRARDYVQMTWLMLQQEKPEDFVIATGVQHSVREFIEASAAHFGLSLTWEGEGVSEVGLVADFNKKKILGLLEQQMQRKEQSRKMCLWMI